MALPIVAVIIGSQSDREKIQPCLDTLDALGIFWERSVLSCHRHRHKKELDEYLGEIKGSQIKVVIAAAGMAAQLPGYVAAELKETRISVIGVALSSPEFPNALDALLSIVRMPPGVPLLCAGIDKAGAINAALAAASLLYAADFITGDRLEGFYRKMTEEKPAQVRCETSSTGKEGEKE